MENERIYFLSIVLLASSLFIAPGDAFALNSCTVGDRVAVTNPNGATIVMPQTGTVTVTLLCSRAGDRNRFGVWSPNGRELDRNAKNTNDGTVWQLGTITAGTEIEFYITNPDRETWHTGPASRNFDGMVHADVIYNGSNQWQVGFEDVSNFNNRNDRDYNDVVFLVTLNPTAPIPPVPPVCMPNFGQQCVGNNLYWFNSCGVQGQIAQFCANGCSANACIGGGGGIPDPNAACNRDLDCGISQFVGQPFCQGNGVYQNYQSYTCQNPGTAQAQCTNQSTVRLSQVCSSNQLCSNGSCSNSTPGAACNSNTDCGTSGFTGGLFCVGNAVYQNYTTYTCQNAGSAIATCTNSTSQQPRQFCGNGQMCSNGTCATANYYGGGYQGGCTYHAFQRCNGNALYWYDSCGNQQDVAQYCNNGCYGNTCNTWYYPWYSNTYYNYGGGYNYGNGYGYGYGYGGMWL